jgi:hypothetical protein
MKLLLEVEVIKLNPDHILCISFIYYFTCLGSLWPSSGKIFMLSLYFAAIFPVLANVYN